MQESRFRGDNQHFDFFQLDKTSKTAILLEKE
jgi:hypothetical protein